MNFHDALLQKCYSVNLVEAGTDDLCQVRALVATYDQFRMLEGRHSAHVHETLEVLLSGELRPALRSWYQRRDSGTDPAAMEIRDELNELTGGRLEAPVGDPGTSP